MGSVKIKLDINDNKKFTNSWKLNNSLLNEKWIKMEMKNKIKNF